MHYIDFKDAQIQLGRYLHSKLTGEKMTEFLCKRAQKLANKWFADLKHPVLIPQSEIRIIGCTLAFNLGAVQVSKWHTKFNRDQFEIHKTVPSAIALGYANKVQLYIADVENVPHLCARDTPH